MSSGGWTVKHFVDNLWYTFDMSNGDILFSTVTPASKLSFLYWIVWLIIRSARKTVFSSCIFFTVNIFEVTLGFDNVITITMKIWVASNRQENDCRKMLYTKYCKLNAIYRIGTSQCSLSQFCQQQVHVKAVIRFFVSSCFITRFLSAFQLE